MLPYTKTESFMLDGNSYPDERAALQAAIVKATGLNAGIATTIMQCAPVLSTLLTRCIMIDPPMPAKAAHAKAEFLCDECGYAPAECGCGVTKALPCESNEGKVGVRALTADDL